jgi:putative NADPH-quinone reductase
MLSKTHNNILIILASPKTESDQRMDFVYDVTKKIANDLNTKNVNVSAIDLCSDKEFLASDYLKSSDSKVIEYQIKINKADLLIFFTPIMNDAIPSILKGFIDNIFVQGFAINYENKLTVGKMQDKELLVFAFDNRPKWESMFIFGDQVSNFFNKTVRITFGFKKVDLFHVFNFRSMPKQSLVKLEQKIISKINKLNIDSKTLG